MDSLSYDPGAEPVIERGRGMYRPQLDSMAASTECCQDSFMVLARGRLGALRWLYVMSKGSALLDTSYNSGVWIKLVCIYDIGIYNE